MTLAECDCEFDYPPDPDDPEQESLHYTRTCGSCGCVWGSNHCKHDVVQNPCPECGWRLAGRRTPMELIGFQRMWGQ